MFKKASLLLTALFLIACGGGESGNESGNKRIRVSGSTSVSPIMSKLAEDFETKNPDYQILIESVGSSIGVQDTIAGKNDIGMASRNIKDSELADVDVTVLCGDGIVVIVNNDSKATEITKEQLVNLYVGNIAVGDASKAISREDGSGTRAAFTELTGIAVDTPLPATVEILDGTGKVKTAVINDNAKLGYISLGALDDTLKGLAYNDGTQETAVIPTVLNIQTGEYRLSRNFNIVTKKGEPVREEVQLFLTYLGSDDATKIIVESGFIPNN